MPSLCSKHTHLGFIKAIWDNLGFSDEMKSSREDSAAIHNYIDSQ